MQVANQDSSYGKLDWLTFTTDSKSGYLTTLKLLAKHIAEGDAYAAQQIQAVHKASLRNLTELAEKLDMELTNVEVDHEEIGLHNLAADIDGIQEFADMTIIRFLEKAESFLAYMPQFRKRIKIMMLTTNEAFITGRKMDMIMKGLLQSCMETYNIKIEEKEKEK